MSFNNYIYVQIAPYFMLESVTGEQLEEKRY